MKAALGPERKDVSLCCISPAVLGGPTTARCYPAGVKPAFSPRLTPLGSALQHLDHGAAQAGRRIRDGDPRRLHRLDLVFGPALAAGDDGAGMAHAPAGWCCASRD